MAAQVAGEYLQELEETTGGLRPAAIVEDARKGSVLHKCFEWDDQKAADQYRVVQAREMIRCLVVVEHDGDTTTENRAFVVVTPDPEEKVNVYVSVKTAMEQEGYRTQVIQRAIAELAAYQKKYQNLKELAGVFREAEKVRKKFNWERGVESKASYGG